MPAAESVISFPGLSLFLGAKDIRISTAGAGQIRRDIPRLVSLAEAGQLDLASMISRCIALDVVEGALQSLERGGVIRSVITSR